MFIAPFPGSPLLTSTFVGHAEITTNTAPPTLTFSISFSPANSNRYLIAGLNMFAASPDFISAVTIGGISATQIVSFSPHNGDYVGLWAAKVPTNTTQTVVATVSGGQTILRSGCVLYDLEGVNILNAPTTGSWTTNGFSTTIPSIVAGSVLLVDFLCESPSGPPTITYTGVNEDCHAVMNTFWVNSSASKNLTSAQTSYVFGASVTGSTPLTFGAYAVFSP